MLPLSSTTSSRTLTSAPLIVVCSALVVAILLVMIGEPDHFRNDGAQYLSTTEHILAGEGVRTSALYFEAQVAQGFPAVQTVWPMGLPALAAMVAQVTGVDAATALQVVNAAFHGGCGLLLFWLVTALGGSRWLSVVLALTYLLYRPALNLVLVAAAEPGFHFVSLATAVCLVLALRDGGAAHRKWLFAAGCFAASAIFFRYPAIVLGAGLVGAMALAVVDWRRPFAALADVALVALPSVLVAGGFALRNLAAVDRLTGGPDSGRPQTLSDLLIQFKWVIGDTLGVTVSAEAFWVSLVGLSAFALLFAVSFVTLGFHGVMRDRPRRVLIVFVALASMFTLLLFFGMALKTTAYVLESRYFQIMVPLLIVAGVAAWPSRMAGRARGLQSLRFGPHASSPTYDGGNDAGLAENALSGVAATALAIVVAINLSMLLESLQSESAVTHVQSALEAEFDGAPLQTRLTQEASAATPILSNRSQALYVALRRPTLGIPERRIAARVWTPDEIVARARRFGVRYVVVFPQIPEGSADGSDDFVLTLLEAARPDLIEQYRDERVVLFEVADGGGAPDATGGESNPDRVAAQ